MKKKIIVVRKSCVTGKAVWIYRGTSSNYLRKIYLKVCKKEMRRVKTWTKTLEQRSSNIAKFLSECLAMIPASELTAKQKEAVKRIKACGATTITCYRGFYDHIIESRRQRGKDTEKE